MTNIISRSPDRSPEPKKNTLYSFAVIIEPLVPNKERQSLKAYFDKYPFPFEIEEWALSVVGGNYKVADSFKLEELEL
jgi:hypothetical protein